MGLRIYAVNFRPTDWYVNDFDSVVNSIQLPDSGHSLLVFPEYTFLPAVLPALGSDNSDMIIETAWAQLSAAASRAAEKRQIYLMVCGLERTESGIQNVATLFGPGGELLQRTVKVSLTDWEQRLGITPGNSNDIRVIDLAGHRLGTAVCMDAFTDQYRQRLADQEAQILLVPSANPQTWASLTANENWQPAEWAEVSVGSLRFGAIRTVVNPMLHYQGYGLTFDGQGAIVSRSLIAHRCPYIGMDDQVLAEFVFCETPDHPVGSIDL